MRVYMDWEFLEEGNSVYPISVGMVCEDGAELYYEFLQAPWEKIYNHNWLKENVLPALHKKYSIAVATGEGNQVMASTLYIRGKVREFLYEASQDSPIELWGWYSAYDHVCLAQLFGRMVDLPGFVPMWTNDLKQEVMRLGNPRVPSMREPSEKPHNALDDARAELRMHQWIEGYNSARDARARRRPTHFDPIFMEDDYYPSQG